jgi:hypothetical protein
VDAAGDLAGRQLGVSRWKCARQSRCSGGLIFPAALASEAVTREWEFALGQEKFKDRLIPVSIKSVGELPWILGKLQMLRPSSPDAAARAIVERLKSGSTHSPRKSRAAS